MNTLTLNYNGLPLHANREAWFNATEIAAMFGKRPIDWLRLPETERYIAALCKREAEKQQIRRQRPNTTRYMAASQTSRSLCPLV